MAGGRSPSDGSDMLPMVKNGWSEWSRHVLAELERLNDHVKGLEDKIDGMKDDWHQEIVKIQVDLAMLQVKAGVWGLLAGAIPVAIMVLFEIFKPR